MSRTVTTTVYTLDELADRARESARNRYRERGFDYDWYSDVYENFSQICDILGIRLSTRTVSLHNNRHTEAPCIWFSGLWSQGDGACFEGSYQYQAQAARNIREHAPQDTELHRIADALLAVQQRHFGQLQTDIQHQGRYYHAHTRYPP